MSKLSFLNSDLNPTPLSLENRRLQFNSDASSISHDSARMSLVSTVEGFFKTDNENVETANDCVKTDRAVLAN